MKSPSTKIFFSNLDGLRSVAFLIVFFHHTFLPTFQQLPIAGTFYERILTTISYGGTGVSIFFVLSGFLITFLLLTEKKKQGRINIPYFYVRRLLRIWPLYYAVIIFAVTIFPILKARLGDPDDLGINQVYYYLFLSNFDAIHIISRFGVIPQMMSGVTWSVSVEEQFYLVWPLLFTITPKKFYKGIFFLVIIICILFRVSNNDNKTVLYYHSLSVCGDLAVGGLSAYYAFTSQKFKDFFKNLSTTAILSTYFLGFTWLMFGDMHVSSVYLNPYIRLISTLFFAFIILEQNYSDKSFYKFSNSRLLSFWGKYTYGLYMLHAVALWISTIILAKGFSITNPDLFLPSIVRNIIGFFIALGLSYVSYEYFEKRILLFKDKFSFIENRAVNKE